VSPLLTLLPATVPTAPSGVNGVPGNAQVTLSWTPPLSDGGASITGYIVTPHAGGVAQTPLVLASTATTQVVSGLTNGTAYTFTVAATNSAGTGAASPPSAAITPTGPAGTLTITNGSGRGRPDKGDQIVVAFASPPDPSAFCSLWSLGLTTSLTGVVTAAKTSGNDQITSVSDPLCVGGFHFGTIDLGQTGYFNTTVTFTGSTISWNGTNTLTITLGQPSIGDPTNKAPSVAVYTPDPALGLKGSIASPSETQF
jgi:hypothetical protein